MLPGYSIIPSVTNQPSGGAWFPMDDHNSWGWRSSWSAMQPIPEEQRASAGAPPTLIEGTVKTVANKRNDYRIDRELAAHQTFTGIWDFRAAGHDGHREYGTDHGPVAEHLGTADLAIIMYRRRMLRLAHEIQQGIEPFAAAHGDSYRVRALDTLDSAGDLDELLRNHDEEVFHSVH